ncbi:Stress response protein nst1 [Ascosphaera pollenicola]|nr:Stress response protein nst1 [Ascosphaera pollenicola]
MAGPDDLKEHAASKEDFYALLGLEPTAQDTEVRRAYRRTALKYHPDKIANPTPADIDKFHLLQIAYDVLSEPTVRQLYDNAREARERKKRETEMLAGARRKMKEDLEARERGAKRTWEAANADAKAEQAAQDMLEAEIRRLAEDGARRRRQKEELLKREILEEEERIEQEREARERAKEEERKARRGNLGGDTVPEEDRMVKIRWIREGLGAQLDKDRLSTLFSRFGKIESAFLLKDKKQRIGESGKKKLVATGVIVFASIVGAHAAVQDMEKQKGDEWDVIYSIAWAKGQAPDFASAQSEANSSSDSKRDPSAEPPKKAPRHLYNFPGLNKPASKPSDTGKAPSFASFSSATATSQKQTTYTDKPAMSGPSLEEITLIRLREAARNAEKKKLEEQIREEDEKADAAERRGSNAQ